MRRQLEYFLAFAIVASASGVNLPSAHAKKIGTTCTKVNAKSWDGNIPITCQKKANGKLLWAKYESPGKSLPSKSPSNNSTNSPTTGSTKPSSTSSNSQMLKVSKIIALRAGIAVQVTNLSMNSSHTHRAYDWLLKSSTGKQIDSGYISDFPWIPPSGSTWILLRGVKLESESLAILELSKVPTFDELPGEGDLPKISGLTFSSATKQVGSLDETSLSFKLENLSNSLALKEGFQFWITCLDANAQVSWISEPSQLGKRIPPRGFSNISLSLNESSQNCSVISVGMSLRFQKEPIPTVSSSNKPSHPNAPGEFNLEILVTTGYAITEDYLGKRLDNDLVKRACSTGYVYDTVKDKLNYRAKIGDQFRIESSGATIAIGNLSTYELVSETEIGPRYQPLKGTLCILKAQISNVPAANFYAVYFKGVRVGDYSLIDIKKGLVFNQIGLP